MIYFHDDDNWEQKDLQKEFFNLADDFPYAFFVCVGADVLNGAAKYSFVINLCYCWYKPIPTRMTTASNTKTNFVPRNLNEIIIKIELLVFAVGILVQQTQEYRFGAREFKRITLIHKITTFVLA